MEGKLELLSDFEAGLDKLLEIATTQRRNDIENWLDAHEDDRQYHRYTALRLEGTCDWIFNHSAYTKWKSEDFSETGLKLLWIYGPAGFGKTILCARLVQHVKQMLKLPTAYCFSSSHAQTSDELDGVMRSWIAQLTQNDESILDLVQLLRHKQKTRRASKADLWGLLKEISSRSHSLVFVLDGLDEFKMTDHSRELFLRDLKRACASTRVRILITSRNELDIETQLTALDTNPPEYTTMECRISIENIKDDVDLFAQAVVAEKLPNKDEDFRQELAGAIASRCEGMFLWIKLQQDRLRSGKSKRELRSIVQAMPQGLFDTYRRSWESIQGLANEDRERAISILRWLAFAYRPLTVQELTEALVLDFDDDKEAFNEDYLPETIDDEYVNGEIKGLCGSLVELRPGVNDSSISSRTIHLVHASVQDFLASALPPSPLLRQPGSVSSPCAMHHVLLGLRCVRFLNCSQAWNLSDHEPCRSFTIYAADSWFEHLSNIQAYGNRVSSLVNNFLKPGNQNFSNWAKWYERTDPGTSNMSEREQSPAASFYYACLFGLLSAMDFLYHDEKMGINSVGGHFGTSLQAVCTKGHLAAFQRLIQWGADVNVSAGTFGNALNAAAGYGRLDMVRVLLEHGADPNSAGLKLFWSPLHEAAKHSHFEVAKLLLEQGAKVDSRNNDGHTPLHLAASSESPGSTQHLPEHGVHTNYPGHHGTPSHVEALTRRYNVVVLLLEHGAKIEARTDLGQTPLYFAARKGDVKLVLLLLARGADVNAQSETGATPLHIATNNNRLTVADFLLLGGANLDAHIDGETPLHLAAENGFLELALALILRGADVNAESFAGWTPLHLATENGHPEMAELLLQRGALIKADLSGWTPLHFAAGNGYLELGICLIQNKAAINAKTTNGYTPLHLAAVNGSLGLTVRLIQQKADINARTVTSQTPLLLAAMCGHRGIVKALLQQGAEVNAQDRHGKTPFAAAAHNNHLNIADLLLEEGASIGALQIDWPIHSFIQEGNLHFFRKLLKEGFNINSKTSWEVHILRSAITMGSNELIDLLIRNGADLSATDDFGMTCAGWLWLLRPPYRYLTEKKGYLGEMPLSMNIAVLSRSISSEAARRGKSSGLRNINFYMLGQCLLRMGLDEEARLAYQQKLLLEDGPHPICNVCVQRANEVDPWFVCKTCPEIDLCESCMIEHTKVCLRDICRHHQFLQVVGTEAKIRPEQAEALNEWLIKIEERYRY